MRKILLVSVAMILLTSLLLTGCDLASLAEQFLPKKVESIPDAVATEPPTTAPVETEPPTTVPPTTAPTESPTRPTEPLSTSFPYLMVLPAETPIYKRPGTSSQFVQYVGIDGTYTIMEEARDANGSRWGRLKSGLGWVNVTDPLCTPTSRYPVTISQASQSVLGREHYQAYIDVEYSRYVAIQAHDTIYDLKIAFVNGDQPPKEVYSRSLLLPDMPLVASLSFAGDFYSYTITYTDDAGYSYSHRIYESGMDGSLIVNY